jgi:hypothetical protein
MKYFFSTTMKKIKFILQIQNIQLDINKNNSNLY